MKRIKHEIKQEVKQDKQEIIKQEIIKEQIIKHETVKKEVKPKIKVEAKPETLSEAERVSIKRKIDDSTPIHLNNNANNANVTPNSTTPIFTPPNINPITTTTSNNMNAKTKIPRTATVNYPKGDKTIPYLGQATTYYSRAQLQRRMQGNQFGGTYQFPKGAKKFDPKQVLYATFTKEWNPEFPSIAHEAKLETLDMLKNLRKPLPFFLKKDNNQWGFEGCFKYVADDYLSMDTIPASCRKLHEKYTNTNMVWKVYLAKDEGASIAVKRDILRCNCSGKCICIPESKIKQEME